MAVINPEWVTKEVGSFQTAEEMNTLATAVKNNAVELQTDITNLSTHVNNKSNPHEVTKAQLNLENVDNVSDVNKPVSIAQAEAIAVVQTDIDNHEANLSNPHEVTKAQVGLSEVDNTSDLNKPISIAQQTAINAASTVFNNHVNDTDNPHNVTKAQIGLSAVDNTSDANKPISLATQTALNLKADKTRQVIAGSGLTGGGTLESDRTINVAATDDSIIVAADSIKVDTQNLLTSTSVTKPLAANQGKVLDEKITQVGADLNETLFNISPNLLNKNDINFLIGKYLPSLNTNELYNTTGFISCINGDQFIISVDGVESPSARFVYFYNESGAEVGTPITSSVSRFVINSIDAVKFRVSYPASNVNIQIEKGNTVTQYYTFGTKMLKSDIIANDSIGIEKMSDSAVELSVSKNLIIPSQCVGGYLNTAYGSINSSDTYKTTGFIKINELANYYHSNDLNFPARYVCFYAQENTGSYLGINTSLQNVYKINVPVGAKYVKLTFYASEQWYQFEESESATEYEEYYTPSKGFLVAEKSISTEKLKDKAVTFEKLNSDLQNRIGEIKAYYLTGKSTSLSDAESITLGSNRVKNRKRLSFTATINNFNSIILGHGHSTDYLGSWVEINGTNITRYISTTTTTSTTIAHNLIIQNNIQILIEQNDEEKINIRLTSNGSTFTYNEFTWYGSAGDIYITSVGSTLLDCVLSWTCKSLNSDIWAFGDSYFSLTASDRWPTYLIRGGHTNLLLNAQSGGKSINAYNDLLSLLQLGSPKKILWGLGMNDPDTTSVNNSWNSIINNISILCDRKGIELILATIPNVSNTSYQNLYKNEIVRSSGRRYIDFAKAVNAESSGATWYSGMLNIDNVHPTTLGAITLYHQAITDLPELLDC